MWDRGGGVLEHGKCSRGSLYTSCFSVVGIVLFSNVNVVLSSLTIQGEASIILPRAVSPTTPDLSHISLI